MRIRIVQRPEGRIDGVDLHRFETGAIYDVNVSIGTYLMVGGYAQAVADSGPVRVVPLDATTEIRNRVRHVTDKVTEASVKKRRIP